TSFFRRHTLGKDFFLTYRVPNPSVEKGQGKILLETLHSVPRAYDVATMLNPNVAPVFEVILPMTTSELEIQRVKSYYEKIIIGQKNSKLGPKDVSVKEWVGDFQPENIHVIPLFEDYNAFRNAHSIVEKYLKGKKQEYQRVFLARSDPALNYGSVSAVLLAKLTLMNLHELQEKLSVDIFPIVGVGSAPFRGNFAPDKVTNCGEEYPSVQTYTLQSSFKYDHPFRDVVNAVDMLEHMRRRPPLHIEEKKALGYIEKIRKEYQKQIASIADVINGIAPYVPPKRARKLHVGLFGYARSLKGISLPRAIKFCASFYSIGIPPELLGLSGLTEKEFDDVHSIYTKMDYDLADSVRYLNKRNLMKMPKPVRDGVTKVLGWMEYERDADYCEVTSRIYSNFQKGRNALIAEDVKSAAWMRKFLG
ncbi:TPA: phosphoenolpyruvate carboxylase, partial [Candidatus Micrarchaeota archaeon]|nr:phosphoenolpyruvate carboxylase [Candidatus Micrarchaeota archaeon]